MAFEAYNDGDYNRAARLLRRYIVNNPNDDFAMAAFSFYVKSLQYELTDIQIARRLLLLSLAELDNDYLKTEILIARAAFLEREEDFVKALIALANAAQLTEDFEQTERIKLIKAMLFINSLNNPENAIPLLEEIISETPPESYLYELASNEFNLALDTYYNLSKKNTDELINNSLPEEYSLDQNFPNPFNPTTTIKYAIPENGKVSIKVFDILGKEIATLVNEYMDPGEYRVSFDASSLSSGVYFYTIRANNFMAAEKMLLIK